MPAAAAATDWASIITALGLLVTALAGAFNTIMVHWARREIATQGENIQKIETATNSMKDALVAKTGEAAHAAGLAEGKSAGEATAVAALRAASTGRVE